MQNTDMNDNFTGKVIIITGASSGIGGATAKLLAGKGAKVVLGARREDNLKRIANEIRHSGGQAAYQPLDVTRQEEDNGQRAHGGAGQPTLVKRSALNRR